MSVSAVPKIDAHQHFWRYSPENYRWINDQMTVLKQDLLPKNLIPQLAAHGIQGSVLVQACSRFDETRWLLNLAEENDFVKAVVGWVDIAGSALGSQLALLQQQPLLRGVRHQVQDEASPADWLANSAVGRGVEQVQRQGYVYEMLVNQQHLDALATFAGRHDRHYLVLDHFGKPDLSQGVAHWVKQVKPLAAMPHVSCKLSGLLTEPRPRGFAPNDLLPWFDAALSLFGSQRLMFGSDWPVCLLAGDYGNGKSLCQQATEALSPTERDAIFGGNACKIYALHSDLTGVSHESAS
ncbi:amidohydrolase [Rouxiella silvae]|uniref:Amidohydrolase n=1 Tax=Rouxiella silvae TaxID=1646373 RepID=A0ABX3TYF9_9GAMM|nr:amidohydrolase family protein [Rouxiella silvae]ORJ20250.1 amidohydrolase [Rouxiella silvae]